MPALELGTPIMCSPVSEYMSVICTCSILSSFFMLCPLHFLRLFLKWSNSSTTLSLRYSFPDQRNCSVTPTSCVSMLLV